MEGVATIVKNHLKSHTIKVKEGEGNDEYLITRLDHIDPPINITEVLKKNGHSRYSENMG